jgi:hypothetical protein
MNKESLKTIGSVLGWSAVVGIGVVLVWFLAYLVPGGWFCGMQNTLFPLSDHECALITYGGIGLLKALIWVFFLAPWIAIQIVLRKKRG